MDIHLFSNIGYPLIMIMIHFQILQWNNLCKDTYEWCDKFWDYCNYNTNK